MRRRELLKATAVGTGLWVAGPCATRGAEPAETRVETDVLVVGGGTAGTIAAIQAGRAGASTLLANSALRVQASCMAMGQAAGAAAALVTHGQGGPHRVPLQKLKNLLVQHGAIVP
ncbi:MAG: FAD-dependent oxidoreductase [Planctomycetota bacterium]|nr:FAD-dependent oxidoreductase [Planctomycetota bacterium]